MMVGGTPFSIYNTYAPNQIEYVVGDAGARILMTEQAYLPQVLEARKSLPDLEHVIVIDGDVPEGGSRSRTSRARGRVRRRRVGRADQAGDDILTLIYTSGTTGPPKGVSSCIRNLLSACEGVDALIEFPEDGRVISWLPSAHVAERNAHHYLPDRLRTADHVLRRPARHPAVPARGAAVVVLRRAAHLREAQGRAGDRGRGHARGAARSR